jgi:hypothetical protein
MATARTYYVRVTLTPVLNFVSGGREIIIIIIIITITIIIIITGF